ncbi:flagellar hook-basal body complex protein [Cochlodiniinecator piscidefendens]|uniref:flagellar hook-basal body complex protein n=1 Tax=Cochlodiniinecator piscidefendens TaxID=2715756 RepID=UPI00140AF20A|nr:flagellar hook-basal body complex protein [Cochlodiniinecator piscidefendens]
MEAATYTTLTRQSGLRREMQVVANNIANISTTGFRREGLVFSEYISEIEGQSRSISMATANVQFNEHAQGPLSHTGGTFDFAVEGEGFFLIETPEGEQLTRNGSFTPDANGELVTHDGYRVLDLGGAPIFIPPDAGPIASASDGTLSAGGQPLAQIGLFNPIDMSELSRRNGVRFAVENGVEPIEGSPILQGFLEDSNVNPVMEIARMIEVQRAYEQGKGLMDKEDERIRGVLQTLGR